MGENSMEKFESEFQTVGRRRIAQLEKHDKSAQYSRMILDSNPLAVAVLDHEMNITDCNEAALKLLDVPKKKQFKEHFFRYSMPIQPNGMFAGELARELIQEALKTMETTAEWMFRNSKGEPVPCEVTAKRIDYDDTQFIILYIRDLRSEIKTQAEVKEITERNKIMIDATPIGFVFFDQEFKVVDCNPAALSLFGIPTKEVFIKEFFTLNPKHQADGKHSSKTFKTNMQKTFNDGRFSFEWDHLTRSGEALPVEVTFVRVEHRGKYRIAGYFRDLREHRAMINEMQLVEQQLREAKELAEASVKVKTEFLANMSHEIRTPMNAVLGVTEILIQYEHLPRDVEEGLSKIYNACDMLLGIINDILDFSKIEAGKLDIVPEKYMTASLVNDSVHLNMMRIESKPIAFELVMGKDIPENLIGDELRIKQILNNLLSNAFKYTDEGSVVMSINVDRGAADDCVTLVLNVRDTGRGMTKKQLNMLFEEYSRFHESATRTIEGTGLGLTITRHLVNLMGGELKVDSEPGVGTSVTVRLPQGIIGDSVISKEESENLQKFRENFMTHKYKKRSQIVRDQMPYGRVLIVDDVETNLYVASGLMRPYKLHIETALRGREAINKIIDGNVYDIIFMDHMMPEMDGIEVIKHLRALGYKHSIIALTANAVVGQADMFLENGFDDFLSKPIDIRQLNHILNKHIRDKQPSEVLAATRLKSKSKAAQSNGQLLLDPLLLESFIRDARNSLSTLENICSKAAWAKKKDKLGKYTITVHGMKSSLWNIDEPELSEFAYLLEMAAREENINLITEHTPGFIDELRSLLEKFEAQCGNNEEYSDADSEDVYEKLSAIVEMCAEYNRAGTLKLISEIVLCTKETRALLESVQASVSGSDFEEAGNAVAEYLRG